MFDNLRDSDESPLADDLAQLASQIQPDPAFLNDLSRQLRAQRHMADQNGHRKEPIMLTQKTATLPQTRPLLPARGWAAAAVIFIISAVLMALLWGGSPNEVRTSLLQTPEATPVQSDTPVDLEVATGQAPRINSRFGMASNWTGGTLDDANPADTFRATAPNDGVLHLIIYSNFEPHFSYSVTPSEGAVLEEPALHASFSGGKQTFGLWLNLPIRAGTEVSFDLGMEQAGAGGQYLLRVSSYDPYMQISGPDFRIGLELRDSPLMPDIEMMFNQNGPVLQEWGRSDTYRYFMFYGGAGQMLNVSTGSTYPTSTRLTVFHRNTLQFISDSEGGTGYNAEIYRYILPEDGQYGILVQANGGASDPWIEFKLTDTYVQRWNERRSGMEFDTQKGSPRALVIFDTSAGENIRFSVEPGGGYSYEVGATYRLQLVQNGVEVGAIEPDAATMTGSIELTLAEDGPVTVVFVPLGDKYAGIIRLRLERLES